MNSGCHCSCWYQGWAIGHFHGHGLRASQGVSTEGIVSSAKLRSLFFQFGGGLSCLSLPGLHSLHSICSFSVAGAHRLAVTRWTLTLLRFEFEAQPSLSMALTKTCPLSCSWITKTSKQFLPSFIAREQTHLKALLVPHAEPLCRIDLFC